jgi:ABC-type molybdate transport system substrate-binding protein
VSNRFSSLGLLSAAVLSAAGLAACGATTGVSTGNLSGDSRLVAQTISNLQSDAQNDDKKVCNNDLASSLVAKLKAGGADCATVIKNQLNEVDNFDLALDGANAVTVTGDTAVARVKSTSANKTRADTLTLVKEGGRWKVAGLGS